MSFSSVSNFDLFGNTYQSNNGYFDFMDVSSDGPNSSVFNRVCNIIKPNIETGPWIAGGSVRCELYGEKINDFDIYFSSYDQYASVISTLSDYQTCNSFETDNAVSLKLTNDITIQLIKRQFFPSARDVINSFDLTCCQLITDGKSFVFGDTTQQDIADKRLRFTENVDLTRPFINRILKYTLYGFKVDPSVIDKIKSKSMANLDPFDEY